MSKTLNLVLCLGLFASPLAFGIDYSEQIPGPDFERRLSAAAAKQWFREHKLNLKRDFPGAAPGAGDSAYDFLESIRYETLSDMENAKLMEAELVESPWSDFYWPIYLGVLAYRYSDQNFPGSSDWRKNADYVADVVGKVATPSELSPAEKYDMLVGDTDHSLTKTMIDEGRAYYDRFKKVESWMGICHGWAPASYFLPRPRNEVRAVAPNGTEITFKPSDIKALASLLWANAGVRMRFIGGRCNEKDPEFDDKRRPVDQTCLDNNPGTWHLVVVNQIGFHRKSFVMDKTFDYEVWNQPVVSYQYSYFNPKTGKAARTLNEALVARSDYSEDPYATVRGETATSIVGIKMAVTYVVETRPSTRSYDSENFDAHQTDEYTYDLELDVHGRIVGGEWHENLHPDFLWNPLPNSRAIGGGDQYLSQFPDKWNVKDAVPPLWQTVAQKSSTYRLPLALIVEELIRASQR